MAKYTVELNDIVKSGLKIFNFDYVFFDQTKKLTFEKMFIDHFLFSEIGFETVGRFQHYLKNKCNEVLPYYNLLFKTALYEYDVKNNYNLTETLTKTNSNNRISGGKATQKGSNLENNTVNGNKTNTLLSNTGHTENNALTKDSKKVGSDTPNGLLAMANIETNVYASKAEIDKETENTILTTTDNVNATGHDISTDTANNTVSFNNETITDNTDGMTGLENYKLERVGDIGVDTTPDKLKKHIEIQKILTTVYSQFFEECNDLFMQIY